jgi:uncharacterized protein (UPF0332 family)
MKQDVKKHLRNAEEILRELEHLMAGGFYKGVFSRAYYAMFHAASAAMLAGEIEEKTRQDIVSAFDDAFVKTGWLDKKFYQYFRQASYTRNESDAVSFASADHRQAQTIFVRTKKFVEACRNLCE